MSEWVSFILLQAGCSPAVLTKTDGFNVLRFSAEFGHMHTSAKAETSLLKDAAIMTSPAGSWRLKLRVFVMTVVVHPLIWMDRSSVHQSNPPAINPSIIHPSIGIDEDS